MHNTSSQLYKYISNLIIDFFKSQKIQAGDRYNLYLEDKENLRVGPHGFFAFSVDSQQDLKDLKSKIDLYCYREKTNLPEVLLKDKRLSFKDLDGNIWQVEVQTYIPNQISRNIIQEDVRNY